MQQQRPTPSCLLIFLLCSSFSALAIQNTTCYFPTGDEISDQNDFYQACPSSFGGDNFRMCCKTDGSFNDVCVSNGLCSRPRNPGLGEEQGLLRSTCTDPSWTSPSCLNLCTTGIGESINFLISISLCYGKDHLADANNIQISTASRQTTPNNTCVHAPTAPSAAKPKNPPSTLPRTLQWTHAARKEKVSSYKAMAECPT